MPRDDLANPISDPTSFPPASAPHCFGCPFSDIYLCICQVQRESNPLAASAKLWALQLSVQSPITRPRVLAVGESFHTYRP